MNYPNTPELEKITRRSMAFGFGDNSAGPQGSMSMFDYILKYVMNVVIWLKPKFLQGVLSLHLNS